MFSADALERARSFADTRARPLERVRLAHLLGEAEPGDVVRALRAFATTDGGLGQALEPDCRAPESSALAVLTGLDILRQHRGSDPASRHLLGTLIAWLVAQVERDEQGRCVWPFLPATAQASPHAPWWDQSQPGELAATFAGFVANPGVALTAHLWRAEGAMPGSVAAQLLDALTRQAVAVCDAGLSAEEVNAHDALAHFAAEPAVPAPAREVAVAYLRRVLPDRVMSREGDFAAYGIHPLWIAPGPDHPLAATLAPQIDLALDHTIATQDADGSWAPFWDWGGWDHASWAIAEQEWRGCLVVRNVAALLAHGRVVGH